MSFLDTILDIIFPVNCVSCGKGGFDLCRKCLSGSPQAERESAKWIYPLFDYRHPPIKKAISLLKYKSKKRLAEVFADVLYPKILEELSELSIMENFSDPLLVPIPLSPNRKRERGFNQSLLICKKLIELDKNRPACTDRNFKLEDSVLIKPKDTEHQARILDRTKRIKNIINTFAVKNAEKIKSRNIILIDDVTTTGATLSEARKILKASGAKKVIAFTVAH